MYGGARWLCGLLSIGLCALASCGSDSHDGAQDSSGPAYGSVTRLAGGRYHTCALRPDGAIYCWGQGAYRQLGGDYGYQGTARRIAAFADASALECGHRFTCALRPGGAVWCWGDNDHGQAGSAPTEPCGDSVIDSVCVTTPQPVTGLAQGIVELALGADHACARTSEGSVLCWGNNEQGQAGVSTLGDIKSPQAVAGVSGASQIAAGDAHTCALLGSPGAVSCWGANGNGQVGSGSTATAVTAPATVAGVTTAVELVAGSEHTCARLASGGVVCWGYNYLGQLGNGSTRPTRATQPQRVLGLDDAVQLAAGRYHTCARRKSGSIVCWGYNSKGELGDGTTDDKTSPVAVKSAESAAFLAAGAWHTCATFGTGQVRCWGDDLGGQLGDNRVTSSPNPEPISTQGLPP